jgi:hypothetical protein
MGFREQNSDQEIRDVSAGETGSERTAPSTVDDRHNILCCAKLRRATRRGGPVVLEPSGDRAQLFGRERARCC